MKKGAVFDLDGTLIDTSALHTKAWIKLFSKYGIELSKEEIEEHSGKKNIFFIELVTGKRNRNNLDAHALSREKDSIVMDIIRNEPPVLQPHAQQLLTMLKAQGTKLALATSATKSTAELLAKDLLEIFEVAVFADDITLSKPNPEIFLLAVQKLNLKPEECVVFEDAESGVRAAKTGGFYCVAKNNHLGQNLTGADLIIEEYKPEELIKLFSSSGRNF